MKTLRPIKSANPFLASMAEKLDHSLSKLKPEEAVVLVLLKRRLKKNPSSRLATPKCPPKEPCALHAAVVCKESETPMNP